MHFEIVPATEEGESIVTRALSLERLFQYLDDLKFQDVAPGEKFEVSMNPKKLARIWW